MEFVNRKNELKFIKECEDLSMKKLFSLCIYGLRRVGKTRLILKSLKKDDLYFFVNKDKISSSLLKEFEDSLKSRKILTELESLRDWDEFFEILFERFKGKIVFDEFQNFLYVDRAVFGILQKNIDLHENKKGILMVFSGSTVGLIKKIFFDRKEPLYGRLKRRMELKPLSFYDVVQVCNKLAIKDMEDIIALYAVFGGFPQYYVAIEDEGLNGKRADEIFERFFFMENAVFEDEVSTILSLEFGKRRGIYYAILTAIANGNTRISEIASYLRKKETSLTRQINELVNYFDMVGIKKQVFGSKTIMHIKHPLIDFWFRYFYRDLSRYKIREKLLLDKIRKNLGSYIGNSFEKICEQILINWKIVPFEITSMGTQWGKFKGEKGKNTYEIDILATNEEKNEILFGECKWKEKINAEKIAMELIEKAGYVDWPSKKEKENRKDIYVIFAKSFKRKINDVNGKKIYCFDLRDIGKIVKKK